MPAPKHPFATVLAAATPEQLCVVWEALAQWVDNSDPDESDTTPEQHAAGVDLLARIEATLTADWITA